MKKRQTLASDSCVERIQTWKRPRLSIPGLTLQSEVQTPPYNNPNLSNEQQLNSCINKTEKKEYATPVSAKPSHVLLDPELTLTDLETTESPEVFLLRGGLRVRNVKRSIRDLMPTKAFIHLLEHEVSCIPDSNYMQMRQNGHLKPSRRLGILFIDLI